MFLPCNLTPEEASRLAHKFAVRIAPNHTAEEAERQSRLAQKRMVMARLRAERKGQPTDQFPPRVRARKEA